MQNPRNGLKARLKAGEQTVGIWKSLDGYTVCEMLAAAGYDWIVIDAEHLPMSDAEVLRDLQIIAGYPGTSAVVRPVQNDTAAIKRILDLGAQSLVIPYVETAEEAAAAVRAMRYGPRGVRGVAGLTRASRFGRVTDYAAHADDELCLIVQVETATGLRNLDAIAAVEGVDAVFIGPADLAASMGYPGRPGAREVVTAIETAIIRLKELGVPSGILTLDKAFTKRCIELGAAFVAVGVDAHLLGQSADALAAEFGRGAAG